MGRKRKNSAAAGEQSFSELRDKIDQALKQKEPNPAKRKSDDDSAAKQGPRKKQQRQKPGPNSPHSERPKENGAQDRKKAPPASDKALLDEIRALGGDEQDLDLVMGVSSDSENDYGYSSSSVSQNVRQELAQFANQLGFSQTVMEDAASDSEDAEDVEDSEGEMSEAESADSSNDPAPLSSKKGATIFEPRADWHAATLKKLPDPRSDDVAPHRAALESLAEHARKLLDEDSSSYAKTFLASSTHKFLSTIMSSGTMNDKVSALTLAVQESPVHNIRALEGLMSLASKKNRSQAIIALGAVVDLMGPGLVLPSERKLRAFNQQPGLVGALQKAAVSSWDPSTKLPAGLTGPHLISWAYEDWLKSTYFKLVQLLEVWCGDEIEYSRSRALDFIYGLLREKPEQEANLLKLLVNRLGDRDRKISSRASYLLLQLQSTHPGMKAVIIRTIEHEIILRPGEPLKARYYAINTLNQTILSSKEASVAEGLLKIYFGTFTAMLKSGEMASVSHPSEASDTKTKPAGRQRKPPPQKGGNEGDLAEKVVSAVLVGINRAVPFAEGNDAMLESQMDTLFRIAHSSNFNTSIQAMLLIQQLVATKSFSSDRFYRVLYESLLDPRLPASSKHAMYLNLLLRALKADVNTKRVKAFVKRMLQGLAMHQPPFACGVLYVLSQLRKTLPGLLTLIEEPEEHQGQADSGESRQDGHGDSKGEQYDGRKRDPEYSNAHNTCLWEIEPILRHYHPAVLVYASSVMGSDVATEKPDLESHSLIRFLDKFAYRNPKTKELTRGGSIMQPLQVSNSGSDVWLRSKSAAASGASVNNASFWAKKVENVAAEDAFFHEYFSHIGRTGEAPKRGKASKLEAGKEDEDEDEVWKALTAGQGGEDDDDEDMEEEEPEMDEDFEAAMAEDDDSASDLPNWDSTDESDESGEDVEDGQDEFVAAGSAFDDEDEEEGADEQPSKAAKPKSRRQQLRELPMFASVDDYAELLAQEEEI